jgi:hypothetical protein
MQVTDLNTTTRHYSLIVLANDARETARTAWIQASKAYQQDPTIANSQAVSTTRSAWDEAEEAFEQVRLMNKHLHGKRL